MTQEEWRTFAGGNYEVSNHGNVRQKTPGRRTWPGRPLTRVLMGMGYYVVNPVMDGKNVLMYVHQIVATVFIGECPDGREVNHKDGNKLNNYADNLEYISHGDNMRHARSMNLICDRRTYSDDEVESVRRMYRGGSSFADISRETGISRRYCRELALGNARRDTYVS
jgi:hypothetical protein